MKCIRFYMVSLTKKGRYFMILPDGKRIRPTNQKRIIFMKMAKLPSEFAFFKNKNRKQLLVVCSCQCPYQTRFGHSDLPSGRSAEVWPVLGLLAGYGQLRPDLIGVTPLVGRGQLASLWTALLLVGQHSLLFFLFEGIKGNY